MLHSLFWLLYLFGFNHPATTTELLTLPEPKPIVQQVPQHHASRSRERSTIDNFYRLSMCETGHVNKPNYTGKYRGYFQFDIRTWNSVGGTGDPLDYTYEEQKHFAQILKNDRGWSPWPQCARKLGLF